MSIRRQLTVASPLTAGDLAGAFSDMITLRDRGDEVREMLSKEFRATDVLLTDSGTSALVLALRMVARPGVPIAMPAYACVDLIAAARRANVRVTLFDTDPHTLSPDMDSLQRVLEGGVSAVVVAHLYGFPVDMPAVMRAARSAGVPVIEDAAQHASATIAGKPAGSFGDATVLSFGRGKGTTSGRGGALLFRETPHKLEHPSSRDMPRAGSMKDFVVAKASWALGRPMLYGIPASMPFLHLGETVYHEAGEPLQMSRGAVALLRRTLPRMRQTALARRANALVLRDAADQSREVEAVRSIDIGESGYLRFPVLLRGKHREAPSLGIASAYPRPLSLEPEIQPLLTASTEPLHGAHELARRLTTLPTHHMVDGRDLRRISDWLRSS